MSTILFILAGIVLAIVIMSRLPGLEHFAKPLVGMLFTILQAVVENLWAWGVFLAKSLWYAHLDLIKHLILSEDAIDPSVKMKKEADGPT
jgi:hypothetical protein